MFCVSSAMLVSLPLLSVTTTANLGPELKVGEINGGLLELDIQILNTGDVPINNVEWNVSVNGGILNKINARGNSIVSRIEANNNEWDRYPATGNGYKLFGIGLITITVTAKAEGVDEATKTIKGLALFSFIIPLG